MRDESAFVYDILVGDQYTNDLTTTPRLFRQHYHPVLETVAAAPSEETQECHAPNGMNWARRTLSKTPREGVPAGRNL